MTSETAPPEALASHPLAEVALRIFWERPIQDRSTLASALLGPNVATDEEATHLGTDRAAAYQVVAADVLSYLLARGDVERDEAGRFRLCDRWPVPMHDQLRAVRRAADFPASLAGRAPIEWREQVTWAARAMLGSQLADAMTLGDENNPDELRRHVLGAAREALGEEPSESMVGRMREASLARDEGQPCGLEALPGMLRLVLDIRRPDWRERLEHEAILAVVREAVDEELNCPHVRAMQRSLIAQAARVAVDWARRQELTESNEDRDLLAAVVEHARAALDDAPAEAEGATTEDGLVVTWINLFRSTFGGLDGSNPDVASTVLMIVEREARIELDSGLPAA